MFSFGAIKPEYTQTYKGRRSYTLWEQSWKHARAAEISAELKTFHLFHILFSDESCSTKETTRSAQNWAMEVCLSFTLLILPGPNCFLQLKPQPRAWILSVFCKTHKRHVCACRCLSRPQARPRHSVELPPWNCCSVKLRRCYLPLKGRQHEGHYGGSSHLMSAKNARGPDQMGVRWPPLFWADLSLQRVTRHHTFLWRQPASYHGGPSKMWKWNMKWKPRKWHICSHFISSFLWAENVIPWLQLAGIISYYIPPVVGVFTPFGNNNRVDTSRKQIAYLVQINWTR